MSNNPRTVKKPAPPGSKPAAGKQSQKGYVAPTPQKKQRAVSPVVLVVVGVIVVGVIAAIAIALTSGGDKARTPEGVQQTASVTVEGDNLAPYDASQADAAVGEPAPTLTGETFDGSAVTINPGGGEDYTMVVFAAHWCPHCQKEIPVIADWMAAGSTPENLNVYAVSTGVRNDYMTSQLNWPPSTWFDEVGWPAGTVLVDSGPDEASDGEQEQAAGLAYGVSGYPTVVMVGPDGNVIERHSGEFGVNGSESFADWVTRTMSSAQG